MLAVHHYDPVIERFVLAAKNGSRRDLLRVFGHRLADLASSVDGAGAATITWVPASRHGRRRRGYDQARLLARSLAHRSGRPILPLLTRVGGRSQAGQRRIERLSGPELSCRVRPPARVILVDDVVTTGASLAAAAAALREAGGHHVVGLCVASAAATRDQSSYSARSQPSMVIP